MTDSQFFGVLNLNKPEGATSRKIVDLVARRVKPAKAGHAGTLDPLATGVLVVCVGAATRLIPHIQVQRKVYRGRFLLGRRSDTDDITGQVIETPDATAVTREQLAELLPRFQGTIEQVPPQYSAVKVAGRRAYRLARKGREVELSPKQVEVYNLELLAFEHPEFELQIECGSGTYIRSIGRDLGELLGCGAVMSALTRTQIGPFRLETAVTPEDLEQRPIADLLLPAAHAVADLPRSVCSDNELTEIAFGRPVRCPASLNLRNGENVALLTPDGGLAAVARFRQTNNTLAPKQVFPRPDSR